MTHTPRAASLLAEAARLRARASELWAADRRFGLFGQRHADEAAELRSQADQIEQSVLIRFVPLRAIDIAACDASARAETERRVMAETNPRLTKALREIERVTGGRIYYPRAAVRTAQ